MFGVLFPWNFSRYAVSGTDDLAQLRHAGVELILDIDILAVERQRAEVVDDSDGDPGGRVVRGHVGELAVQGCCAQASDQRDQFDDSFRHVIPLDGTGVRECPRDLVYDML